MIFKAAIVRNTPGGKVLMDLYKKSKDNRRIRIQRKDLSKLRTDLKGVTHYHDYHLGLLSISVAQLQEEKVIFYGEEV